MRAEKRLMVQDLAAVALRFEDYDPKLELIETEMKDRIVKFACETKDPGACALAMESFQGCRRVAVRPLKGDRRDPLLTIDVDLDQGVGHGAILAEGAVERRQNNAIRCDAGAGFL